jgi:hypothetical protein
MVFLWQKLRLHPIFIQIMHWEYWPFGVLYAPIFPIWFWLCLRARSFFFFSAANPSIRHGGFLMEKKHEINELLPAGSYPATCYFPAGTGALTVLEEVRQQNMQYPLILKPDIGMRGMSVEKIYSDAELIRYANESRVDFLVQNLIPFDEEVGIFYYRMPGEPNGKITGIVYKTFLTVTGDGVSTTAELLGKDSRFVLQLPVLLASMPAIRTEVLPAGEQQILVPFGNHARGAKFLDYSHRITPALEQTIDALALQIPGFYYGRLDIRFRNWELLEQGKDFSIVELNGAGSEPTHIYDPKHTVFFAWKEIVRHWRLLYRISIANHRKGIPFMNRQQGLQMFRDNKQQVACISRQQGV